MAASRNQGWQPKGELPPSICGMVMFACSLQSQSAAKELITNIALCAYKCGFDDATFEAAMKQMMDERKPE